METITGVVERITYHDEESGYGVIKVRVKGFSGLIALTGKFISINVGTVIEAKGNFVINKKFGRQFSVKEYKESLPASIYGIEKYLGSGLIEGIGAKFAKQIVELQLRLLILTTTGSDYVCVSLHFGAFLS